MQIIFPRITYHLSLNFLTVIHSFHPVSFHRKRKIKKKKKKGVIIYTRNVRILTFINPRNRARTANTQRASWLVSNVSLHEYNWTRAAHIYCDSRFLCIRPPRRENYNPGNSHDSRLHSYYQSTCDIEMYTVIS